MLAKEAIFHKYEACGNDYLVIPGDQNWFKPEPELIKKMCSTEIGVGSDGVLWGGNLESGNYSLRIFNPDGGEAEKSGNGLRIFARYLLDTGSWTGEERKVHTIGGECLIKKESDGRISVNMGGASFEPEDIPLNDNEPWIQKELRINQEVFSVTCLSVGNPHCVIQFDELPSDLRVREIGPMIENYPSFPNRINVQFVQVVDRSNVQMKIWERGAGLTKSSGSSSSAACYALNSLDLVDSNIEVKMEGGVLEIKIKEGEIWLKGPVNHIFTGTLSQDFLLH